MKESKYRNRQSKKRKRKLFCKLAICEIVYVNFLFLYVRCPFSFKLLIDNYKYQWAQHWSLRHTTSLGPPVLLYDLPVSVQPQQLLTPSKCNNCITDTVATTIGTWWHFQKVLQLLAQVMPIAPPNPWPLPARKTGVTGAAQYPRPSPRWPTPWLGNILPVHSCTIKHTQTLSW